MPKRATSQGQRCATISPVRQRRMLEDQPPCVQGNPGGQNCCWLPYFGARTAWPGGQLPIGSELRPVISLTSIIESGPQRDAAKPPPLPNRACLRRSHDVGSRAAPPAFARLVLIAQSTSPTRGSAILPAKRWPKTCFPLDAVNCSFKRAAASTCGPAVGTLRHGIQSGLTDAQIRRSLVVVALLLRYSFARLTSIGVSA